MELRVLFVYALIGLIIAFSLWLGLRQRDRRVERRQHWRNQP